MLAGKYVIFSFTPPGLQHRQHILAEKHENRIEKRILKQYDLFFISGPNVLTPVVPRQKNKQKRRSWKRRQVTKEKKRSERKR